MNYQDAILEYAPEYWDKSDDDQVPLHSHSEEFKQIAYEVGCVLGNSDKTITRIIRVQNVHDLGQCLVSGQMLKVANPYSRYYMVRRFIKVKEQYLNKALQYNLDHRRCGLNQLNFSTSIPSGSLSYNDLLLVVQVITTNYDSSVITPNNSLEYFIDYVVMF